MLRRRQREKVMIIKKNIAVKRLYSIALLWTFSLSLFLVQLIPSIQAAPSIPESFIESPVSEPNIDVLTYSPMLGVINNNLPITFTHRTPESTEELLAINDEVKKVLDFYVRPIVDIEKRAKMLHLILFGKQFLRIRYNNGPTKTAQQTFDTRSGNCLSHASLYIASARYLGMRAKFQSVKIPEDWQQEKDYFSVPGHVNAMISSSQGKIVAEFIETFFETDMRKMKTKKISDKEALALYYNNIGIEALILEDRPSALTYLKKAIEINNQDATFWSNLGVFYIGEKNYPEAEKAYLEARAIEKNNLTVLTNLYLLYKRTNNIEKADIFAERVRRYQMRNPYFMATLAKKKLQSKNYNEAISLLKKAIKKKPNEENFHLLLSQAYFENNQYSKSIHTLKQAKAEFTGTESNKLQDKLSNLEAYYHQHQ